MNAKVKDIRIEYYRSSGPGGQRKNKKETAVRARHIPTGITAIATEFRSQARNRALAVKRLKERLQRLKAKRKPRIPTKMPRAVREQILQEKKRKAEIKKLRQKLREW